MTTDQPHSVRLNNAMVPKSYNLFVHVNLAEWSYSAEEVIVLEKNARYTGAPTTDIRLHAAATMEIDAIDGAELISRDPSSQTIQLRLPSSSLEEATISLRFRHTMQEELRGFYRVRYNYGGKQHRMASTHFEPTSARLFFICQDEPAARADFTFAAALPSSEEHYTVVSNGRLLSKEQVGNEVVHRFDMIPKVPPYLTACVVGELERISTTANHVAISLYTTPGKSVRGQFALKITAFALTTFEAFFRRAFPLPKLDVVAVPDFPIGGMENWGCINCIESILVEEGTSSLSAVKRASDLLCHEVSHNWFGNLVGIDWWEGLWLKEGFASWCGYFASSLYEASWKSMTDASMRVAGAKITDMYQHSHPVEVPIHDPGDITQIFDSISYEKGMGIVLMLQSYLGPEKWSDAVAHYIDLFAYQGTRTEQLWAALEESAKEPIAEAMNSFTTQLGYPLVSVARVVESGGAATNNNNNNNNGTTKRLRLTQQRCKLASTTTTEKSVWCIPVSVEGLLGDAARATIMVRGTEAMELELPESMCQLDWLTANPSRTGFYHVRYDDGLFTSWVHNFGKLSSANRAAIIADVAACIRMGFDDAPRLFALAKCVRAQAADEDVEVLRELFSAMGELASSIEDKSVAKEMLRRELGFILNLAEQKVGKTPINNVEMMRQTFALNSALDLIVKVLTPEEAREHALYHWAIAESLAFLHAANQASPTTKPTATYNTATLAATLTVYMRLCPESTTSAKNEALMQRFAGVDGDDELCRALLHAMCMSPDTDFALTILSHCIHNTSVRSHFGTTIFAALAHNSSFQEAAVWSYFTNNFARVDKQWGGGQFRIQMIVSLVGETLSGDAAADAFANFFATHPLPNAKLAIGRAEEEIRLRAWLNRKWSPVLSS